MARATRPVQVNLLIGSKSDEAKVEESSLLGIFRALGVTFRWDVISAHRNLDELISNCRRDYKAGIQVFICVAGKAAALPGIVSAALGGMAPVLGVGISSSNQLDGLAAMLSMTTMPSGRPVMYCGMDEAGLDNAAIAACQILALSNPEIRDRLRQYLQKTNKQPAYDIYLNPVY